jgi:hypothetical protein
MTKTKKQLSSKKSDQEIKSEASTTSKLWRFSNKFIYSLFFNHKNLKFNADLWTNKNLKQWSFKIQWNTLLIRTFIWAFRSIRSILVYRVEKSKDCNRSGEVLSTSDLERLSTDLKCLSISNPNLLRTEMWEYDDEKQSEEIKAPTTLMQEVRYTLGLGLGSLASQNHLIQKKKQNQASKTIILLQHCCQKVGSQNGEKKF